ncbi:MAG TPA: molybdopterin biosynthesis protein [Anaerolineales bacterium]|nr:molybdopterin biosynthesis protein [Anaerolineales bacterium]
MTQQLYLRDIPLPEALARFDQLLSAEGMDKVLDAEEIPLNEKAAGRILGVPVWARLSSPHYHGAAMDGFAVRSGDTSGASPATPVVLGVLERAAYLDTGDPLPDWADAVIPIEEIEPVSADGRPAADPRRPEAIRIRASVPPWRHIRVMGEDIVSSELVLAAGQKLRPVDLGAAAAAGYGSLMVVRKPAVAIIPTGDELVSVGSEVAAGEIIEFNSVVLAAQIESWGGIPIRFPVVPDDHEAIKEQLSVAADVYDLVLILAGSSAGSEDYSARVINEVGTLAVHGVAVRPGHPVILGILGKSGGKRSPVIGVPGFPVSSALTAEIFIEPLISKWLGSRPKSPPVLKAELTRKITSPAGDDDYVRVAVGRVGGRLLASPLSRGAGVITSLTRADGLVVLPRGTQGAAAGAEVEVRLYRDPDEIERTILATGSHDLTLDLIAQFLSPLGARLSSTNAGSLGGILAVKRGFAHLAGSHLLDPETGEYNIRYVEEYLGDLQIRIYCLVHRQQGLMVARDNPKGLTGIADLTRDDVSYVNRQRGAGTRVLLDYSLDLLGIDPAQIQGYNREEYTHLAVASVISSGRADSGMGIAAAAQALKLDFIPLQQERYDLIIPKEISESPLLKPLFAVINDPAFAAAVEALPGYDVSQMGQLIADLS